MQQETEQYESIWFRRYKDYVQDCINAKTNPYGFKEWLSFPDPAPSNTGEPNLIHLYHDYTIACKEDEQEPEPFAEWIANTQTTPSTSTGSEDPQVQQDEQSAIDERFKQLLDELIDLQKDLANSRHIDSQEPHS